MTTLLTNPIAVTVAYAEYTSDVTISAATEGTANLIVTAGSFTPNGTDTYWIEFFCPQSVPANADFIILCLFDNGSFVCRLCLHAASTNNNATLFARRKLTPTNAAHVYDIRGFRGGANGLMKAATGVSGGNPPGWINIWKAI